MRPTNEPMRNLKEVITLKEVAFGDMRIWWQEMGIYQGDAMSTLKLDRAANAIYGP